MEKWLPKPREQNRRRKEEKEDADADATADDKQLQAVLGDGKLEAKDDGGLKGKNNKQSQRRKINTDEVKKQTF